MNELDLFEEVAESALIDPENMALLLVRFAINLVVTWFIIHFQYYKQSRRRDYYFTFFLISISIFFLIFLLGGVKLKVGFALGLFAIFGIIRYRTETMPVREMTYLFVIISLSVINALAITISYMELLATNLIFILAIWLCEKNRWLKHTATKLVLYDKVELIMPEKRDELIADLQTRTGLHITNVEVGHIDFLKDTAMLKIHYDSDSEVNNTVNELLKFPKDQPM